RKYIIAKEEARASYYNYYTGKQWGHSESYDLYINSSMLGIENTEAFIAELIKKRFKL
nr:cytidylate kinase family protein [Prevotella sp.]